MKKYINLSLLVSVLVLVAIALSVPATAQNNTTGNRIWSADENLSLQYTWTAHSYSGFYFDLDTGEGSETLTVDLQNPTSRTIQAGALEYSTTPINTGFDRSAWGSYQVIGFMAERYFAGYTNNTQFTDDDVSLISNGQLTRVLINEDNRRSVFAGSAIVLNEGYRLNIVEVDLSGDSVLLNLVKDGQIVDTAIISGNTDYVYETKLGTQDDVPLIAVHFSTIFRGTETNAVFIQGIFQISENYVEIETGDRFGRMEVQSFSENEIIMDNPNSIPLTRGSTTTIMGKLQFVVADDATLRFGPVVDTSQPGTYELRGTVVEGEAFTWTPLNFEGFYYNIDEGVGTESLEITSLSGRTIGSGDLVYRSVPQQVSFEYAPWGSFNVIGFLAEKYFAGYVDNRFTGNESLLSGGQLSKVLIDSDSRASLFTGSSLVLEEGYTLAVEEVDLDGSRVLVRLDKDGSEVDTGIISSGGDYVYEADVGDTDNIPIIIVHFREIFRGTETNAVFVEGIFQISENVIEVESGETFGRMEVSSVSSDEIVMTSDRSITLSRDSSISVMDNIRFRVADSNAVRFYPYVEVTTATDADPLEINVPRAIAQNRPVNIEVTSRGAAVENAVVMFANTQVGNTSANGTISFTPTTVGTFTVTAERQGFATGSAEVEVISPDDVSRRLAIGVSPSQVNVGDNINISVTTLIDGRPVGDVEVLYDGRLVGTTGTDGMVNHTAMDAGIHRISTSSDQYLEAELNIEVQGPEARYSYSNLTIEPLLAETGDDVTISASVRNIGTETGEEDVQLLINGNVEASEQVILDPGQEETVSFTVSMEEAGIYNVTIGTLNGNFEIEESQGIPAAGIVIALMAVIAVALWVARKRT
jgi:S-layer protein (TIGR01567 family)